VITPPALTDAGPYLATRMSATAATGVLVVDVLSAKSGSVTPAGGVILAVLVMAPFAVPLTVPAIVMETLPPAGKLGINPLTELPTGEMPAGQVAPPIALAQLAVMPVTSLGTKSLKLALLAALGPALLMTKL
jgi:hypothetical protein